MVQFCYICKVQDPNVSLHVFPVNPENRKKWLSAFNLKEDDIFKHTRVCSMHFSPECFSVTPYGKRVLCKQSFPTLLLPKQKLRKPLREKNTELETQSIAATVVCAVSCKTDEINIRDKSKGSEDVISASRKRIMSTSESSNEPEHPLNTKRYKKDEDYSRASFSKNSDYSVLPLALQYESATNPVPSSSKESEQVICRNSKASSATDIENLFSSPTQGENHQKIFDSPENAKRHYVYNKVNRKVFLQDELFEHIKEQDMFFTHRHQILKAIINYYFQIRIFYYCKTISTNQTIRRKLNKLILFKNQ